MKAVAKEIVSRLTGYSDETFEIEKLVKVSDGLWSVLVREPKKEEIEDSEIEDSEKTEVSFEGV